MAITLQDLEPRASGRTTADERLRALNDLLDQLKTTEQGLRLFKRIERGDCERVAVHATVERAFLTHAYSILSQYLRRNRRDELTERHVAQFRDVLNDFLESQPAMPPKKPLGARRKGGNAKGPVRASGESLEQIVASLLWQRAIEPTAEPAAAPAPAETTDTVSRAPQDTASSEAPGKVAENPPAAGVPVSDWPDSSIPVQRPDWEQTPGAGLFEMAGSSGVALQQIREQVREFEGLLKTLSRALKSVEDTQDEPTFRGLLSSGIDEVLDAHGSLATRLSGLADGLRGVRDASREAAGAWLAVRRALRRDLATGLPDNAAFLARLEGEMQRAHRQQMPLTLVLLMPAHIEELDRLVGRRAGDEVMCCYADRILSAFRAYDLVARDRADRFALMFPGADQAQAEVALYNTRARVLSAHYEHEGRQLLAPGFCAGVACHVSGETLGSLLARTEAALARARAAGHDTIVVASAEPVAV